MKNNINITKKRKRLTIEILETLDVDNFIKEIKNLIDEALLTRIISVIKHNEIMASRIDIHYINNIIVLEYSNDELKEKNIYILDEYYNIKSYLKIYDKKEWEYFISDNVVKSSNHTLEESNRLLEYIQYLRLLSKRSTFYNNPEYLLVYIGIFDRNRSTIICRDESICLTLKSFYKENLEQMKLEIVDVGNLDIVGSLIMDFKNIDSSYPEYTNNIEIEIYEKYQHKGYATEALKLIIKYLNEQKNYEHFKLLLAMDQDNIYAKKVAINNGAECLYEGVLPKGCSLYLNKRYKDVSLYQISV